MTGGGTVTTGAHPRDVGRSRDICNYQSLFHRDSARITKGRHAEKKHNFFLIFFGIVKTLYIFAFHQSDFTMEYNAYTYDINPTVAETAACCMYRENRDNQVFTSTPPYSAGNQSVRKPSFVLNLFVRLRRTGRLCRIYSFYSAERANYPQFVHSTAQNRQTTPNLSILRRRTGKLPLICPFYCAERANYPKFVHSTAQNGQTTPNLSILLCRTDKLPQIHSLIHKNQIL